MCVLTLSRRATRAVNTFSLGLRLGEKTNKPMSTAGVRSQVMVFGHSQAAYPYRDRAGHVRAPVMEDERARDTRQPLALTLPVCTHARVSVCRAAAAACLASAVLLSRPWSRPHSSEQRVGRHARGSRHRRGAPLVVLPRHGVLGRGLDSEPACATPQNGRLAPGRTAASRWGPVRLSGSS